MNTTTDIQIGASAMVLRIAQPSQANSMGVASPNVTRTKTTRNALMAARYRISRAEGI